MNDRFFLAGAVFFFGLGIYFITSAHRDAIAAVVSF
jgi:hypothetical protein